jgi:hypothetical protein
MTVTKEDIAKAAQTALHKNSAFEGGATLIGTAVLLFVLATAVLGFNHVKTTWVIGAPMVAIGFLMCKGNSPEV